METPTLAVSLTVANPAASLDRLKAAFDITELSRMATPDGTVVHAEFMLGNTHMYLSIGSPEWKAQAMPVGTMASCLFGIDSDNPDAAHKKAVAAGMTSIQEPTDQFWGFRTAIVADPDGYRWNFRKDVENLTPEQVEAKAAKLFGGA